MPQYEPTGEVVSPRDLCDTSKTEALTEAIAAAGLPDDVARFLNHAAHRHTVFNYRRIAEFYANADADVQRLMEASALVIHRRGRRGGSRVRPAV